jgi:thiamine-phosphate pyrophosphorylase
MDTAHRLISNLYAVTPDELRTETLISLVSEALAGGVRLLQYRNKLTDKFLAREQAAALRKLADDAGACLIINDDIELALAVAADGVHLGRDDGPTDVSGAELSSIRQRAVRANARSGRFLVGRSCYNDIDAARVAVATGADYIAFGSFFSSTTKPLATRAELSLIHQAKREFLLPVVAIGGITVENAPQLVAAGADAVAVISSLFDAGNVRLRAKKFISLFSENV